MEERDKRRRPERYPVPSLFLYDIASVPLKGDMHTMEHPFFSLSTKKDIEEKSYVNGDVKVDVVPSTKGHATVFDKDVLLFAVSAIRRQMKDGAEPSPYVSFYASDYFEFSNRAPDGRSYERLRDALTRLKGTVISTTISTGGESTYEAFGLIDSATIRKETANGRVLEWGVKLSDWMYRSVLEAELLTMNRDYFRLRKPLERRIYEIARKHCGTKHEWKIGWEKLHNKTGSKSPLKQFRYLMRDMAKFDLLPDYHLFCDDKFVCFQSKEHMKKLADAKERHDGVPSRIPDYVHTEAKKYAGGYDTRFLEGKWREWVSRQPSPPQKPSAAFIGFCKKYVEFNGTA